MNTLAKPTAEDQEQLRRVEGGLRLLTVPFPHFAGLARTVRVALDDRVPTMGVFASGRMVVNPAFARTLNERELIFVLAHELFHLALRTHDRAVGSDPLRFNYAHDYIINDILRLELQFKQVPAGGLDWPGARKLSAEEIVLEMEKDPSKAPPKSGNVWRSGAGAGRSDRSSGTGGDVFDDGMEREWFPDAEAADRVAETEAVRAAAAKALSLGKVMATMKGAGRGSDPGSSNQLVTALRGMYRTPWEAALQRWLESVSPGDRTFVRPSRRGAERTDVVMPGRRREGWVLNVVLDTSGSMTDEIPRALGAISGFCESVAVDQVRLVQCDTAVTSDRFLSPSELETHEVSGYGGSDLSPALRHLADDARVEAVVVVTDGEIEYPREEMPYALLWVIPAGRSFQPPYGSVVVMQ
ncbi:MAG: hypothetical protein K2R98_15290 [Gemmataceae bacterium]|nr:hypothetical protein [Gemmataceae bacterium]